MKIVIFIDLGFRVGFGHLKRARALGRVLEKNPGFRVVLAALQGGEYLSEGGGDFFISPEINSMADFLTGADILIVDAPHFPAELFSAIKGKIKLLIGIDELSYLRDELDIHICTTLLGLENRIEKRGKTTEYIGPCYFVFGDYNDELSSAARVLNESDYLKREDYIFSFGGSDPSLITEKFLLQVSETAPELLYGKRFTGIIGPGFVAERKKYLRENYPGINWKENLPELFSELSKAFFAFCSGGITAYEALRCGAFPVCIAQHEEQLSVIKNLAALNLAICVGKYDNINRELLENCLLRPYDYVALRKKAVSGFYDLCDGMKGPLRIMEIILNHYQRFE